MPAQRSIVLNGIALSPYRCFYYISTTFQIMFYFVTPKTKNRPSFLCQSCGNFNISLHISLNFGNPKFSARLNVIFLVIPIVSMPKFTVTKHGNLFADKNNIRLSEYFLRIFLIAQASCPKLFTQEQLNFRIFILNSLHIFSTLLFCMIIHNFCILVKNCSSIS